MTEQLREEYKKISHDYTSKKTEPWRDFAEFINSIEFGKHYTIIDVGAGNGRNLNLVETAFPIAFDLSFDLLLEYVGPECGNKITGALPYLPFRKNSANAALCIAVLHHFKDRLKVIQSLDDIKRCIKSNQIIISVWRKWRTQIKPELISAVKENRSIDDIVNVYRPWYDSSGKVIGRRFYHYYTFKELFYQLKEANLGITNYRFLGGRHGDANIFVETF